EFALLNLSVSDIIICGHSECAAMHELVRGREQVALPNLRGWLQHGEDAVAKLQRNPAKKDLHNELSKINVLQHLHHLRSYPIVQERLKSGKLKLHAWWFELKTADVYAFEEEENKFVLIDEEEAAKILKKMS